MSHWPGDRDAAAQPGTGVPERSGPQLQTPLNVRVFYWRLGLGSGSARACKKLSFCPGGLFLTSTLVRALSSQC